MPRSAANRSFGFKAAGLVRILTAADPEELLIAFDELGLVVTARKDLFESIRALAETFAGPAVAILDVWILFNRNLEELILPLINLKTLDVLQAELAFRRAKAIREEARLLDIQVREIDAAEAVFKKDLDELEQQTEEDIALTFL